MGGICVMQARSLDGFHLGHFVFGRLRFRGVAVTSVGGGRVRGHRLAGGGEGKGRTSQMGAMGSGLTTVLIPSSQTAAAWRSAAGGDAGFLTPLRGHAAAMSAGRPGLSHGNSHRRTRGEGPVGEY